MRIGSNIPFHIARAYGLQPTPKAAPITQTQSIAPTNATTPVAPTTTSSAMTQLVGGSVTRNVDFEGVSTPTRPAGHVLPLYTRAADAVEAATGVHVGRSLDIKG